MSTPTGQTLQGNYLQKLSGGATLEQAAAVLNDVIDRLNAQLEAQTFSDGSNQRYIQGYSKGRWPGGDFGIAISQPGQDVSTVVFSALLFAWDFTTNIQYFRGGTQRFYDPNTGKDVGQVGILPDGTGGNAWAKTNQSVDNAYGL